jgi:hypothetical protein
MPSARTVVATANASRYLQQLCKHFAHKVAVDFDPHSARIDFPFGDCRMRADGEALRIDCVSPSPEALARARYVIDDHLSRFSWREKPAIRWTDENEADHDAG